MKNLLLLLLSHGAIFSMELPSLPQRGQKRVWRQSLLAPQGNLPVTKLQLVGRSAFELLPKDLKMEILKILTTARGSTNRARLDNATENIRSFFRINTQFKPLGDDQQIIDFLITELASRYADGDKAAAAIALGTEAAGKWLQERFDPIGKNTKKFDKSLKVNANFIDAAKDGRTNVLKFLLHFVPYPSALPWKDALREAARNNKTKGVRFILSHPIVQNNLVDIMYSVGNDALQSAIENGNEEIVDLLIKAGVDVNRPDDMNRMPLHLAIINGNYPIFRKILGKTRQELLNTEEEEIALFTPLMNAIIEESVPMITDLLNAGAVVNYKNEKQRSALDIVEYEIMMAQSKQNELKKLNEIKALLIKRGAQ